MATGMVGWVTVCGILGLFVAYFKIRWILKQEVSGERLRKIAGYVSQGAMAFLSREFKMLLPFALVAAGLLFLGSRGYLRWEGPAFLFGAACSALAGFIGMRVATQSNSRTTTAAMKGLNEALQVSFAGGSVMGLSVMGLALIGSTVVFLLCIFAFGSDAFSIESISLPILSGFALGASCIALFSRVGGGIFTKAADVGADLVGKIEAGIPEDDPRNPATIADNVGDNVGDVAGMGADLYESFIGSLVGAMILGMAVSGLADETRILLALLPMFLAGVGILASMLGMKFVKVKPGSSPQRALNFGSFVAGGLMAILAFPICIITLKGQDLGGHFTASGLGICTAIGLAVGTAIGLITEYFTGTNRRPVEAIVKACETGPATTLITGMGIGMVSTCLPVLAMCICVLVCYFVAGLYGVAIATIGMQLTLAIQLAVDAFGPIADNAGGLAEMAEFPPEVRKVTDQLDAVGNTTAAIGKGFAVGSAALTAVILFSAFKEAAGINHIEITNPKVLVGMLMGGMIPYLFSSMLMMAVGRAAFTMIEEVRRQFRTIPGLLQDKAEPDYARCVDISTTAALKEMLMPGMLAVFTPIAVGFLGGIEMLLGTLVGITTSGVALAIFMSNAGGAWDNAKKMIEARTSNGKGSDAHKAAVVGDTVGDPFKDTAGPSLNILIKLVCIMSVVIAPMLRAYWGN